MKAEIKKYLPFIAGGVLFVLIKFGKTIVERISTNFAINKAVSNTNKENNTIPATIQGSSVNVNLDTIAGEIYYSFYTSNGKSRFNEDEQTAITSLAKCPKDLINNLKSVYATKYGKILKDDLIEKLSSSEWQKVKYLFE